MPAAVPPSDSKPESAFERNLVGASRNTLITGDGDKLDVQLALGRIEMTVPNRAIRSITRVGVFFDVTGVSGPSNAPSPGSKIIAALASAGENPA